MRRLLAAVALAATSAPAVACINDSELPTHEREFRSSYQADRKPGEVPPSLIREYGPATAAGAGVLLLVGAGVITVRRVKGRG